ELASSASSGASFYSPYQRRRLLRSWPSEARLESENAFQGLSLPAPRAKQQPAGNAFELHNRRRRMQMLVHQLSRRTPEWCFARQHLPQRYTQRIEIRANVHVDPRKLLRTSLLGCTSEAPGN